MKDSRKIARRRYSAELKAQVLSECERPAASVASVAMSHGINANVVHKWRRLAREGAAPLPGASFIPVALPAPSEVALPDIRMELRRGATTMTISWPSAAAGDCAAWMRELLR
jgi:transposase